MHNDVTFLGKVIRVDSASVEVEVTKDIPSAAPIINGRLYKLGQIGTFVKLPIGNMTLFGIVSAVSNVPNRANLDETTVDLGSRFLSVQLVGEQIGDGQFERGVGTYPTINDEAHLVIDRDLHRIYGKRDAGSIELGKHASSETLTIFLDIHRFVLRHAAILGSTGSGKSNTTVSTIKSMLKDYQGSRVVLVDPHGEYSTAFPDANVLRINDKKNPLFIPFWLMNFDELAYFLVGATQRDEQTPQFRRFRELIVERKRANSAKLKAGAVEVDLITADSPIPFNVRELWHYMYWWLNASFSEGPQDRQTKETACVEDVGDFENLVPPRFKPYAVGSAAPYKSKNQLELYPYEKKLISRLKDSRFDFMFHPGEYKDENSKFDLHDLLNSWIGSSQRLTILDLNGVPPEVLDITVGLITRFIYDSMSWGRSSAYTGKGRPLCMAYEEAHAYLGKQSDGGYARNAVERVFKEGRKFGLGAMVISQRPSELSETILAQVGTFVALRLTNSSDQSIVKASAPDNLTTLIDLLPSLRTGEAIVVGEAIKIPSRVRVPLQHPRPTSDDPKLIEAWTKTHTPAASNYKEVVTAIRRQKS
jgi:uncharacterized protein